MYLTGNPQLDQFLAQNPSIDPATVVLDFDNQEPFFGLVDVEKNRIMSKLYRCKKAMNTFADPDFVRFYINNTDLYPDSSFGYIWSIQAYRDSVNWDGVTDKPELLKMLNCYGEHTSSHLDLQLALFATNNKLYDLRIADLSNAAGFNWLGINDHTVTLAAAIQLKELLLHHADMKIAMFIKNNPSFDLSSGQLTTYSPVNWMGINPQQLVEQVTNYNRLVISAPDAAIGDFLAANPFINFKAIDFSDPAVTGILKPGGLSAETIAALVRFQSLFATYADLRLTRFLYLNAGIDPRTTDFDDAAGKLNWTGTDRGALTYLLKDYSRWLNTYPVPEFAILFVNNPGIQPGSFFGDCARAVSMNNGMLQYNYNYNYNNLNWMNLPSATVIADASNYSSGASMFSDQNLVLFCFRNPATDVLSIDPASKTKLDKLNWEGVDRDKVLALIRRYRELTDLYKDKDLVFFFLNNPQMSFRKFLDTNFDYGSPYSFLHASFDMVTQYFQNCYRSYPTISIAAFFRVNNFWDSYPGNDMLTLDLSDQATVEKFNWTGVDRALVIQTLANYQQFMAGRILTDPKDRVLANFLFNNPGITLADIDETNPQALDALEWCGTTPSVVMAMARIPNKAKRTYACTYIADLVAKNPGFSIAAIDFTNQAMVDALDWSGVDDKSAALPMLISYQELWTTMPDISLANLFYDNPGIDPATFDLVNPASADGLVWMDGNRAATVELWKKWQPLLQTYACFPLTVMLLKYSQFDVYTLNLEYTLDWGTMDQPIAHAAIARYQELINTYCSIDIANFCYNNPQQEFMTIDFDDDSAKNLHWVTISDTKSFSDTAKKVQWLIRSFTGKSFLRLCLMNPWLDVKTVMYRTADSRLFDITGQVDPNSFADINKYSRLMNLLADTNMVELAFLNVSYVEEIYDLRSVNPANILWTGTEADRSLALAALARFQALHRRLLWAHNFDEFPFLPMFWFFVNNPGLELPGAVLPDPINKQGLEDQEEAVLNYFDTFQARLKRFRDKDLANFAAVHGASYLTIVDYARTDSYSAFWEGVDKEKVLELIGAYRELLNTYSDPEFAVFMLNNPEILADPGTDLNIRGYLNGTNDQAIIQLSMIWRAVYQKYGDNSVATLVVNNIGLVLDIETFDFSSPEAVKTLNWYGTNKDTLLPALQLFHAQKNSVYDAQVKQLIENNATLNIAEFDATKAKSLNWKGIDGDKDSIISKVEVLKSVRSKYGTGELGDFIFSNAWFQTDTELRIRQYQFNDSTLAGLLVHTFGTLTEVIRYQQLLRRYVDEQFALLLYKYPETLNFVNSDHPTKTLSDFVHLPAYNNEVFVLYSQSATLRYITREFSDPDFRVLIFNNPQISAQGGPGFYTDALIHWSDEQLLIKDSLEAKLGRFRKLEMLFGARLVHFFFNNPGFDILEADLSVNGQVSFGRTTLPLSDDIFTALQAYRHLNEEFSCHYLADIMLSWGTQDFSQEDFRRFTHYTSEQLKDRYTPGEVEIAVAEINRYFDLSQLYADRLLVNFLYTNGHLLIGEELRADNWMKLPPALRTTSFQPVGGAFNYGPKIQVTLEVINRFRNFALRFFDPALPTFFINNADDRVLTPDYAGILTSYKYYTEQNITIEIGAIGVFWGGITGNASQAALMQKLRLYKQYTLRFESIDFITFLVNNNLEINNMLSLDFAFGILTNCDFNLVNSEKYWYIYLTREYADTGLIDFLFNNNMASVQAMVWRGESGYDALNWRLSDRTYIINRVNQYIELQKLYPDPNDYNLSFNNQGIDPLSIIIYNDKQLDALNWQGVDKDWIMRRVMAFREELQAAPSQAIYQFLHDHPDYNLREADLFDPAEIKRLETMGITAGTDYPALIRFRQLIRTYYSGNLVRFLMNNPKADIAAPGFMNQFETYNVEGINDLAKLQRDLLNHHMMLTCSDDLEMVTFLVNNPGLDLIDFTIRAIHDDTVVPAAELFASDRIAAFNQDALRNKLAETGPFDILSYPDPATVNWLYTDKKYILERIFEFLALVARIPNSNNKTLAQESDLNILSFLNVNPGAVSVEEKWGPLKYNQDILKAQFIMFGRFKDTDLGRFMIRNFSIDLFSEQLLVQELQDTLNWQGSERRDLPVKLLRFQRLLRIARGHYPIAALLYNKGINSAQEINNKPGFAVTCTAWINEAGASLSLLDFINQNKIVKSATVANDITALLIATAKQLALKAGHLSATVNTISNSPYFNSMRVNQVPDALRNHFSSLAGYPELFGNTSFCDCEECDSIFGAAAYFVDLMRITDTGITESNQIRNGLSLLERRPDLASIPLTCESTNTVVPYLQIVNEVLETIVDRELSVNKTTFASIAMANAQYPYGLPYHAFLDEIRTFLEPFGTSLSELTQLFSTDEDTGSLKTISILGSSVEEFDFFSKETTDTAIIARQYGLTNIGQTELRKLARVDTFLAQTGISKDRLTALLCNNLGSQELEVPLLREQFYINRTASKDNYLDIITVADQDNLGELYDAIVNLRPGSLDRISRFLRLSDKLGWTSEELDWVLCSLKIETLDEDALAAIARVKQLSVRFSTPVIPLCACWFDIKTTGTGDTQQPATAFDKLFNQLTSPDQPAYHPVTFSESEQYPNPCYTDKALYWTDGQHLLTCLPAAIEDLIAIARWVGYDDLTWFALGVSNLSMLYRYTLAPKLIGCSLNDFLLLATITGRKGTRLLTATAIEELADLYAWTRSAGFSVSEVDFLLNYKAGDQPGAQVKPLFTADEATNLLTSLQAAMQPLLVSAATFKDITFTDEQQQSIDERLTAFQAMPGNMMPAATLAKIRRQIFGNGCLAQFIVDTLVSQDTINATGFVVGKAGSFGPDLVFRIAARFRQANGQEDMVNYDNILQVSNAQANLVSERVMAAFAAQNKKGNETLANFLKSPAALVTALATGLGNVAGSANIAALLNSDSWNPGTVSSKFILDLSKWCTISNRLGLSPGQATGIFAAREAYGLGSDLTLTAAFLQTAHKMTLLNTVSIIPDEVMQLPDWNSDAAAYLHTLLPGANDEKTFIGHLFRMKQCIGLSNRTGLDVRLMKLLAKLPVLPLNDSTNETFKSAALSLRTALRKFAGEDQWPALYKKTAAKVMERKRNALSLMALDLLGARFGDIDSTRKLYEFLLIDTEMSGTAEISYIKQGLNAIQLYLQRCRLGLEEGVSVNTDFFHESWWEWIMNYRVWEANRKVFIYPENYIDPALRKTKTTLFKSLEEQLKQNDVNPESIEDAFRNYFDGFQNLGKLQYTDAYQYNVKDPLRGTVNTLFLFARTHTDPYEHYYITRENGTTWSEWKKIGISINARRVTPVYAFNKLFLFWVELKKNQEQDQTIVGGSGNKKAGIWKATIKYTFYNFNEKWIQPQTLGSERVVNIQSGTKLYAGFDEHLFAEDQPHWDKVVAMVVTPKAMSTQLSGIHFDEKIIVTYGPFVSAIETRPDTGMQGIDGLSDSFAEFQDRMLRARAGLNVIAGKAGYVSLFEAIALDVDMNVHSLAGVNEILFFQNHTPEYNLGSSKLVTGGGVTSLQVPETVNTLRSMESPTDGIIPGYLPLISLPSEHRGGSLISVGNNPGLCLLTDQGETFLFESSSTACISDNQYTAAQDLGFVNRNSFVTDKFNASVSSSMYDILVNLLLVGLLGNVIRVPGEQELIDAVTGGAAAFHRVEENLHAAISMLQKNDTANDQGFNNFVNGFPYIPFLASDWYKDTDEYKGEWFRYWLKKKEIEDSIQAIQNILNTLDHNKIIQIFQDIAPIIATYAGVVLRVLKQITTVISVQKSPTALNGAIAFQRISTNAIPALSGKLFISGIDAVLSPVSQAEPPPDKQTRRFDRFSLSNYPAFGPARPFLSSGDQVDFDGPFGNYYWELFFHAPMLIAGMLNSNRKFSEAQKWLQYIFDPTVQTGKAAGPVVTPQSRFWNFLPFRDHTLETLSQQLHNSKELDVLNNDPFDPHAIARLRIGAYEKAVVMQYIDNLLDWGDQQFGLYTWESLTTATMLYVYAYDLLGARPQSQGSRAANKPVTYAEIRTWFGATDSEVPEFFVQLENSVVTRMENLPSDAPDKVVSPSASMPVSNLESYFCVPENDQFTGYWDRVEDRLFKIRHSLNLQGKAQTLALFEPPIDPMMLVRAAADGNNFFDAIGGSQPLPNYRFTILIDRAKNLAQTVIQLGSALLQAIEKKDAEKLSVLRSSQEILIQKMTLDMKEQQIEEQQHALDGLTANLGGAQHRLEHYQGLLATNINALEIVGLALMGASLETQAVSAGIRGVSIAGFLTPNIFGLADGGSQFGDAINVGAQILDNIASVLSQSSGLVNTIAQYQRRSEEWQLQADNAQFEIDSIQSQIQAVITRMAMIRQELNIQQKNIDHATEIDDFLQSKFSNADLYQWMIGRISTLYYESFTMASQLGLTAQAAYQFELDRYDDTFIGFNAWDSLHKGLLAGESLLFSLQQMEIAYQDNNFRRYELQKTISLRQWYPERFMKFRSGSADEKGMLDFEFTEAMFDFDHPSHYCRKIKSVTISIPAIVGPYQNINAVLTQKTNTIIVEPDIVAVRYLDDKRQTAPTAATYRQNWVPTQQVALSKAVDDSGTFTLDLRDERYLPFEGSGCVSSWSFSMPPGTNRINFNSISDILVKINYTSIDGGQAFGDLVKDYYSGSSQHTYLQVKMINIKQAFPASWQQFMLTAPPAKQNLEFKVTDDLLIPNLNSVNVKNVIVQLLPDGQDSLHLADHISLLAGGAPLEINLQNNFGEKVMNCDTSRLSEQWSVTFDPGTDKTKLLDVLVAIVYEGRPFN